MAKKLSTKQPQSFQQPMAQYQVINKTAKIFPVPYRDSTGALKYLNLRLQKRRQGQRPPVLPASAITPAMKQLEKKGWITLRKL